MAYMLVRHKIEDFDKWKKTFDAAAEMRKANGEKSFKIFTDAGNKNMMTGLFEWDSLDNAKKFMQSEEIKQKMQEAGVAGQPEIHFLEEI